MKILTISESLDFNEEAYNLFNENYIHDKDDLIFKHTFEEACIFINEELFEKQRHIDFIFININSLDFLSKSCKFANDLKASDKIYSSKRFKINSLPIVIYKETNSLYTQEEYYYNIINNLLKDRRNLHWNVDYTTFDGVYNKKIEMTPISLANNPISSSLDIWLNNLNSDIDNLNIDTSELYNLNINHLNKVGENLKILSPQFIENAKSLDYIWTSKTIINDSHLDELLRIIKRYESNSKTRNEKGIHSFLKNADYLLRGESFSQYVYEKQFYYKNSRNYVECDFINFSHSYSFSKNELYEVKLPSERFVTKKGQVRILRQTVKYFEQIGKKYNEYFHDPVHIDEMMYRLKEEGIYEPSLDFNLSLLIGRKADLEENLDTLNQKLLFGNKLLKIITYDNLIDKFEYLHKRTTFWQQVA